MQKKYEGRKKEKKKEGVVVVYVVGARRGCEGELGEGRGKDEGIDCIEYGFSGEEGGDKYLPK